MQNRLYRTLYQLAKNSQKGYLARRCFVSSENSKNEKEPQAKDNTENKEEKENPNTNQNTKEENRVDEEEYDYSKQQQFKSSRVWLWRLGKLVKYTIWLNVGLFFYNYYLIVFKTNPDKHFGALYGYLAVAKSFDYVISDIYSIFTKPAVNKLLPSRPNLGPGYYYPKVLVIDLTGTTVHTEYKLGSGFEIIKRPGLSQFLMRMARNYELVVFSDADTYFVQEVCEALEPPGAQLFTGKLGRESTVLSQGKNIKDLSYLNRDLKDIIVIDCDPDKIKFQPENLLVVERFQGDSSDTELIDLIPFLEDLAKMNVRDVRIELERIGRVGTAKRYKELMEARKSQILQNRKKLGFNVFGSLSGLQTKSQGKN